jgi:hypothetical protein
VSGWVGWLVPVAALFAIGFGATFYLQRIRRPQLETAAGIAALAGMRWRDFMHLVLDAMNKRGYERVFDTASINEDSGYLLERGGQRWLLWSKHGTAYVLGSTAIAELANDIRLRGATGGLLVTPGQFAPEARSLARTQRIELLDGPTLWPELRPLLPEEQRRQVSAPLEAQTRRQVLIAWGGALVMAMLLLTLGDHSRPADSSKAAADRLAPAPQRPKAQRPVETAKAPPAVAPSQVPSDPSQLQRRRKDVETSVSMLPGVDRAVWSTQSTLLVYLADDLADPMPEICPLLEHYDELAASRLQLQPPVGSQRPVRFLQCRYF